MALEKKQSGKSRPKRGGDTSDRVSALRGLAARAAEAKEARNAAPPKPDAPRPVTPPTARRPERPAKPAADSDRPSLVRSMMRNIEKVPAPAPVQAAATAPVQISAPAPAAEAPTTPTVQPPEPPAPPRKVKAAIPASPELEDAFDNAPDDRVKRLRRAAERARQRAVPPEPAAPIASATPKPVHAMPERRDFTPKPLRETSTRAFAGFEWDIASRYLRARRKEGFISVIAGFSLVGIGLGVATLIIVMAVMTGFRETLISQILGVNPHLNVTSQQEKFEDYDTLAIAIREVEGVTRVAPTIEGQVLASKLDRHTGVIVRGIRREDLSTLKVVTDPEISAGSLDNFVGDRGIAMGDGVARKLGLRVGDQVTLVSPDGDLTPFGVTPRSKSYPVTYIFKLGLAQYDSAFVYMPLDQAQLYFNKRGEVDSLEVTVTEPEDIADYVQPIRQAARQSIGIYTWKDIQGSLIGALDVERNVMFLILTMIILVAALNIISGLVMLVKDKARDVAILRTMGMSRGAVLRVFFICGASIGVVGAVAGTILGVLFCLNIGPIQAAVESVFGPVFPSDVYGLSGLPASLETGDVMFTLFMALFLSFIATLFPAWKAANLDPVEALRYE